MRDASSTGLCSGARCLSDLQRVVSANVKLSINVISSVAIENTKINVNVLMTIEYTRVCYNRKC